jgi:hypothetical protein
MKILPSKEIKFELLNNPEESLGRLKRKTEETKKFISPFSDKSFNGFVRKNEFKITSSRTGFGLFCVMTGTIDSVNGNLKIEINKPFQILLTIIILMILSGGLIAAFSGNKPPRPLYFVILLLQILFIRFIVIELIFKFASKESLNRLSDVIDLKWIKN